MPHDYLKKLETIEMEVCAKYKVWVGDLRTRGRANETIIRCRWEIWYRAVNELQSTKYRLERIYGFDHTTIHHGINAINPRS